MEFERSHFHIIFCTLQELISNKNKNHTDSLYSYIVFFFSHYGPFHLAFNMYALQSFAPPLVDIMGKEHFLAIYLSGAVVSSMSSYVYKVSQSVKKSEK